MKRLLTSLLFLLPGFAQSASRIYTGFNYGAFWAVEANAKKKADFLDGFNLAKNLTTNVPFDSARLFTCRAAGTLNEPTEAFDAAVDSNTNLLLGFWITPGQKEDTPDEAVKNEMAALEKGFQKHGQALSDLIIGLSVGSEDIYRAEEANGLGVTAEVVGRTIAQVKKIIAESSFAEYMKDKPIGHVDTAKYAVVDNADFIGMTAYPYWHKDSIDAANASFQASLEDLEQRAGNRSVWIAEMGWPSADTEQHGAAVAGIDELQKFWTEVGCTVFGKYNTFWYELLKDSTPDQKANWGLVDATTREPRIKNLRCGIPEQSTPASLPTNSESIPQSSLPTSNGLAGFKAPPRSNTTFTTLVRSTQLSLDISQAGPSIASFTTSYMTVTKTTTVVKPLTTPSTQSIRNNTSFVTVFITKTIESLVNTEWPAVTTSLNLDRPLSSAISVGLPASSLPSTISTDTVTNATKSTGYCTKCTTTAPAPTPPPVAANWCVTVADIDRNSRPVIVAAGPAGPDGECSSSPTFRGLPYPATDGPAPLSTPASVPARKPWCIAMADIGGTGQMVPVDAGPAELNGECIVPSLYSGIDATVVTTSVLLTSSSSQRACPTSDLVR